jgi:ABC-type antimicrobial peptide transport system permease subunit
VFRAVTAGIRAVAPDIVPYDVQTMGDAIDGAIDGLLLPRIAAWLATTLGVLGLVLAMVGVYGVVAYGAAQRVREMALRVAMGAEPRHLRREVLKSGVTVVLPGLFIGASLAAALALLTANLYFGVAPLDPTAFAGAVGCVGIVGLAACYLPARRAMRVDPVVALRES